MSEQVLFNNTDFKLDIVSQDKFKEDTGVSLEDIIENNTKLTLDMLGISIDVNGVKHTDNKTPYSKNGTKSIEVAKVNTKNTLISKTQSIAKEKNEKEKKELESRDPNFPYVKASVMTDAEKQLYHFMLNNLCQIEKLVIMPKVRLADVINVDSRVTFDKKALYKICNKHVDFLICNRNTLETICVVELDDYTHETDEAKDRDLFVMQALDAAGIPVARIRKRIKMIDRSDLAFTDELINRALAPKCPRCGKKMFPKMARDRHRFYACEDFIGCRTTINIDDSGEKLPQ